MARFGRFATVLVAAVCAVSTVALVAQRGGNVARAEYGGGTPFEVSAFGCIAGLGGHRIVPPGSTIVIRQGIGEQTLGIIQSYLGAEMTAVSVNDGVMTEVSNSWSAPSLSGGFWFSFIRYPTGVTLGPGESMRFTFALFLKKSVPEVFNPAAGGPPGQPAANAAGLQFGGTCIVTASN